MIYYDYERAQWRHKDKPNWRVGMCPDGESSNTHALFKSEREFWDWYNASNGSSPKFTLLPHPYIPGKYAVGSVWGDRPVTCYFRICGHPGTPKQKRVQAAMEGEIAAYDHPPSVPLDEMDDGAYGRYIDNPCN